MSHLKCCWPNTSHSSIVTLLEFIGLLLLVKFPFLCFNPRYLHKNQHLVTACDATEGGIINTVFVLNKTVVCLVWEGAFEIILQNISFNKVSQRQLLTLHIFLAINRAYYEIFQWTEEGGTCCDTY